MRLVYSSEVVPARLRVAVEPTASAGPALLEELLAPHGLRAEHVGGIVYAVVRRPPQPAAAPPAAPPAAPVPIEEVVVASSRYRLADESLLERCELVGGVDSRRAKAASLHWTLAPQGGSLLGRNEPPDDVVENEA